MEIVWRSQKGILRKANNDFAAISLNNYNLTAIIIDAAEKGARPQSFARYWASTVLDRVAQAQSVDIIPVLRQVHRTLVPEYLHELGSYTLIDIDLKHRRGNLFSVGDCRLGMQNDTGVAWLNPPHVLSECLEDMPENAQHILTRSLKARRFTEPEQRQFNWYPDDKLLLCSDGYWKMRGRQVTQLYNDDASSLEIIEGTQTTNVQAESDCDNFYYVVGQ